MTRKTTWIVVADNTKALFHSRVPRGEPTLVATLDHPEGRLHSSELSSDRPGQMHSDMSSRPHSVAQKDSAADLERDRHARRIAADLDDAFAGGRFHELCLAMPPKLLGLVRGHLGARTRDVVVAALAQRMTDMPIGDVVRALDEARAPQALA